MEEYNNNKQSKQSAWKTLDSKLDEDSPCNSCTEKEDCYNCDYFLTGDEEE